MIPLNKELNWLLTVILSGDKGSASAVCDLKTSISLIGWKINITLCKTITLPSWWIVLSVTGIGHLQFKQGTRTTRITKRSKERSKGPRKIQSLLQVEGMAMEQTEHSSRAQRYLGRDLTRLQMCEGAADPVETNEKEERTQRLLWGEGVTSRDVLTNPEGYKVHSRDSSVLRWPSKASGWAKRRGKQTNKRHKEKFKSNKWQTRKN